MRPCVDGRRYPVKAVAGPAVEVSATVFMEGHDEGAAQLLWWTAHDPPLLCFGKSTPDQRNFVLVAVTLDPHAPQETHFEAPPWAFGQPDDGMLEVEELMGESRFLWFSKCQHWYFRTDRPFAVWRLRPAGAA